MRLEVLVIVPIGVVTPFIFVVAVIEAELLIFLLIDKRQIVFYGIYRDHLEFNAAFWARNNFSNILEFLIDNCFAFRTVAHNLPPIKTLLDIQQDCCQLQCGNY